MPVLSRLVLLSSFDVGDRADSCSLCESSKSFSFLFYVICLVISWSFGITDSFYKCLILELVESLALFFLKIDYYCYSIDYSSDGEFLPSVLPRCIAPLVFSSSLSSSILNRCSRYGTMLFFDLRLEFCSICDCSEITCSLNSASIAASSSNDVVCFFCFFLVG